MNCPTFSTFPLRGYVPYAKRREIPKWAVRIQNADM
jgi:hypothetical protein